jgi:hypothetical protein
MFSEISLPVPSQQMMMLRMGDSRRNQVMLPWRVWRVFGNFGSGARQGKLRITQEGTGKSAQISLAASLLLRRIAATSKFSLLG